MRIPSPERPCIARHLHYFELKDETPDEGLTIKDYNYDGKSIAEGGAGLVLGRKVPFATVCLYRIALQALQYEQSTIQIGLGVSTINPDLDPKTGKRDVFNRKKGLTISAHRALTAIDESEMFGHMYGAGILLGRFPVEHAGRAKRAMRRVAKGIDSFILRPALGRSEAIRRLNALEREAQLQADLDLGEMTRALPLRIMSDPRPFVGSLFYNLLRPKNAGLSPADTEQKKE